MGTRNVSVTTAAKLVPGSNPGGYGDDVTVLNTGSATAYLNDGSPDSTTDGQPLSAGSSLIWTKGQPLWVIAPAATTLVVSENTGPIFDAGAIAAQILAQGLASQIATAINVVGVPAIESATILEQFSSVTALNANPGIGGIPIDCSRYQSLRMYFSETYAIGGAYPPPRPYTITWYADAAGTIPVGFDSFNVPTGTNAALVPAASAVVAVPCRGPYFDLGAQSVSVGPSTVGAIVLGSYRPVQDLKWSKLTDGFSGSSGVAITSALGDQGGTFSISSALAAGTVIDYPILPGGDCMSMLSIGANTAQCTFLIRDLYNNRFVYNRPVPVTAAPGNLFVERLVLPNSPVSVAVTIAGANVSVNWTLVSVDKA